MGSPRPKSFADITKDKAVQKDLEKVYGDVDNVEFWTGLIAKDPNPEYIMSIELTKFVANDAFNQALTQPLLSEHVFNAKAGPEVFSEYGWKLVQQVPSIKDILKRNTNGGVEFDSEKADITMTRPDYVIGLAGITKVILFSAFVLFVTNIMTMYYTTDVKSIHPFISNLFTN